MRTLFLLPLGSISEVVKVIRLKTFATRTLITLLITLLMSGLTGVTAESTSENNSLQFKETNTTSSSGKGELPQTDLYMLLLVMIILAAYSFLRPKPKVPEGGEQKTK